MLKSQPSSSLNQLLKLLSDREWHSSEELGSQVSFRFGHTIFEARKKGYQIETRKLANKGFEYRLLCPLNIIDDEKTVATIQDKIPYLKLLVLFGSRARGEQRDNSDWDFAVLYDEDNFKNIPSGYLRFEIYDLLADFFQIPDNKIDIVELSYSSPLMSHYIAQDGKLIYEKEEGIFDQFQQEYQLTPTQLKSLKQKLQEQIDTFLKERGI